MDKAGAIAMSVYGVGWLIGFIRFQFYWSADKRTELKHYREAPALSADDPDGDGDRPFVPVTWTDKLAALAIRIVFGALVAWFWPVFLFNYVAGAWGFFSRKAGPV